MKTHYLFSLVLFSSALSAQTAEPPEVPVSIAYVRNASFNWQHYNALTYACNNGEWAQVRKLVADGADKNVALFCACKAKSRNIALIKELLAAGANADSAPVELCPPLYAAIGNKRVGECEGWASKAATVTAYEEQAELVRLLLEAGANPNTCASYDRIPPIIEATRSGNKATVELLLNAGANVNGRARNGTTALHWAVALHHHDIAELLLEKGALINIPSVTDDYMDNGAVWDFRPGTTPLHCAARFGNTKAVQLLLQHGANINATAKDGATPFLCAAEQNSLEIMRLLIQQGVIIKPRDTEMAQACVDRLNYRQASVCECLEFLVEIGLPIAETDAISAWVSSFNVEALKTLKKIGCRVSPAGSKGESVLFTLLIHTQKNTGQEQIIEIINILTECGADMPTMGYLPLSYCVDKGYDRVFFHLLQLGAPLQPVHEEQKRLLTARASYPYSVEGRQRIMQWLQENHPELLAAEQAEFERREKATVQLQLNKQLLSAAYHGNLANVQNALQAGANVHHANEFNQTALISTYGMSPNLQVVEILLKHGADPNFQPSVNGRKDWHPLTLCCHTGLLRLLVNHGADLNRRGLLGDCVLHAMARRNSDLTACALELGADPTLTDSDGKSALMMVTTIDPAIMLHRAAPQMLQHKDKQGNNALHHIAQKGFYNDTPCPQDLSKLPSPNTAPKINRNIGAEFDGVEIVHFLIKAGISPDSVNNSGQTPLMLAADKGDLSMVALMLKLKANATLTDTNGKSALSYAQNSGNQHIIDLLKKHGAPDGAESDILQAAATGNTAAVLSLIQKGVDVKTPRGIGFEAALAAALNGHEDTLLALMEQGVNLNAISNRSRKMLNVAVEYNNEQAVRMLVKHGANIKDSNNLHGNFGMYGTALDEAAARGNLAMVKLLHELGCPVDTFSHSSMAFGVIGNNTDIVRQLAAYGAKVDIRLGAGSDTPLTLAINAKSMPMVKLLLELGANPNGIQGVSNGAPLRAALRVQDDTLVQTLIEAGAQADYTDRFNQSILHSAVCVNSPQAIALLITHGADVNRQCKVNGRHTTPLINSIRFRKEENAEVVRLLLEAGANPDTKDAAGNTPYFYAAMRNHTDCMQILHAAGADTGCLNKESYTPEDAAH